MHVVIIGGGIIGCATAYYLRQHDVDVTVCEQNRIGHGSTPRAGGGIRAQFTTPVSISLSRVSIETWTQFSEQFNTDINYRRNGYLYLAREDDTANAIRANVEIHNDHGVPTEFLEPEAVTEYCSGIHTDNYVGATYCPTDGYADTERALQGFAIQAAHHGADIHIGRTVTDVKTTGQRVTGVETDTGSIDADYVVNAAGAWAKHVGRLADIDLPITPERRQLIVVEPKTPVEANAPFVTDLDTGAYFRPETNTLAYAGGHFTDESAEANPDTFDRHYDAAWADVVIEKARDVASYFGENTRITQGWAGLYAMTPDHHPIIEEVRPGFITAAGFSGHGFMQSPATGQVVTELIVDGSASLFDISQLTSDRFEQGNPLSEVFYSA